MRPSPRTRTPPAGDGRGATRAFVCVAAAVVLLRVVLAATPAVPAGREAVAWGVLALVLAAATAGLHTQQRLGLPAGGGPAARGLGLAVGVGALGGAALSALDAAFGSAVPRVGWPLSVPFYAYGGVVTELLYRQTALPVMLAMLARTLRQPAASPRVVWPVALGLALLEPMGALGVPTSGAGALVVAVLYAQNVVAALLFVRHGLLAAVPLRLANVAVWDVAWGALAR